MASGGGYPAKAQDPKEEDASDDESEASLGEGESESSDDEEGEHRKEQVITRLSLHRFHRGPHGQEPDGSGPVRIPRLTTAQQLVERAATDYKVRGELSGGIPLSCGIKPGSMRISASKEGFTKELNILFADTAVFEAAKPQAIAIIAIVLRGPQGCSWIGHEPADREQLAQAGVEGWVLSCASSDAISILRKMSACGGIRSGLEFNYQIFSSKKGLGSFGFVRGAVELRSNRIAAVKSLLPKVHPDAVLQEAEMLIKAQGHPHIVQFYGLWAEPTTSEKAKGGKQWFLITDYYNKGDLYDRVVDGRRMMEPDCIRMLQNILAAIVHLHARSIFHRDVKPENLLLDGGKRLVLADFGISCLVTDKQELKKTVGTTGYASPEMLAGEATGFEGDEFGAGIVLYFMFSKSTPFLAPTPALTIEKMNIGVVNLNYACFDHISKDCRKIMLGLICKDVKARLKAHDVLADAFMQKMSMTTATAPNLEPYAHKLKSKASEQSGDLMAVPNFTSPTVNQLPVLQRYQQAAEAAESERSRRRVGLPPS
eukprot:TRINITY_DN103585_c0_g1_i1.p1 TRINITY_DN103585_c0_g1~~TRINITY_DN103585_c0_g1_i1.p1  ORF type:complete len:541 (+),score=105.68 TRINITY_DN103585_c0_g1_i1:110-1732(+)